MNFKEYLNEANKKTIARENLVVYTLNNGEITLDEMINYIEKMGFYLDKKDHESMLFEVNQSRRVLLKYNSSYSKLKYVMDNTDLPKIIYNMATESGMSKASDSLTPADIWGFSKKGKRILLDFQEELSSVNVPNEKKLDKLNNFLQEQFINQNIVGISLKTIKKKGKVSVIGKDSDIIDNGNLSFSHFNAAFYGVDFICKEGFRIKLKGAGPSITSQNKGASSQNGSITSNDKPLLYSLGTTIPYSTTSASGTQKIGNVDIILFNKYKDIWKKYNKYSKKQPDYEFDDLDEKERRYFVVIASHIEFFMENWDDAVKFVSNYSSYPHAGFQFLKIGE